MTTRWVLLLGALATAAALAWQLTTSPERSAGPASTTITIAAHYSSTQIAPLLPCLRRYEALHPGLTIKYQQASYADFLQTILTSRASGAAVDIYNVYSVWAPQLLAAGALDAPPSDVAAFVRRDYSKTTVAAGTIGGKLIGIPTGVSLYQLLYNRKLFAAAKLSGPPRTWRDLERAGAAIVRKNRQGNILIGGYAYGPSTANVVHAFYSQMYAAGMSPYTRDLRRTNLTSSTAQAVLAQQVALFRSGITSNSVAIRDFSAGSVGMVVAANWQRSTLKSAFGDRFEDTVGVAPVPTDGPGGTMFYSFLWTVDANSPVKRQAWDLLKWLNTAQTVEGLSCTGTMLAGMGDLTGNRHDLAVMQRTSLDAFSRQYAAALQAPGATSQPNLWHQAEVDRVLQYYIENAWAGRFAPLAALTAADRQIQTILDEQP